MEAMIFVTAVDIVYMLVCSLEWEIWRDGCLLLNDLLISVFAMTCPTRTHFFYLKYFQIATSHTGTTVLSKRVRMYSSRASLSRAFFQKRSYLPRQQSTAIP
jgi:hypothetical protein